MLLKSPWMPRLSTGSGSPTTRLVDALADDILEGRLSQDDRLPAHRDLSYKLGIGVGTVTKAYGILERRGLVRTSKGSGTFVASAGAPSTSLIDLSRNTPPAAMTDRVLAQTLGAVAKRADSKLYNAYPPIPGYPEYRRIMAHWFARFGFDPDPESVLLTSGAQHALSIAFSTASGIGGAVLMEQFTYAGAISLAKELGRRPIGVAMDDEGMMPDALAAALAACSELQKAVYIIPTAQSPTTSSMGRERRLEIVEVCRRFDVPIIEDDVYALQNRSDRPPIASLAPERTYYVNSLSKTLNPALRIGALVSPAHAVARATEIMAATSFMVSPLSCAVMQQWIMDGTAETIETAIRREAARRYQIAASILGSAMADFGAETYHVWLPLSGPIAEFVAAEAFAARVQLTPHTSMMVNPHDERAGLRLCLGAPSIPDLDCALRVIASVLGGPPKCVS